MSSTVYRINSDGLVHDTVNGEAIVLSLNSGTYYNLTGTAAEIWDMLASGISQADLMRALESHYGQQPAMQGDVEAFLSRLTAENLTSAEEGATSGAAEAFTGGDAWAKPELTAYDDLQDLLTIDPIHDVDDSGWPNAKRS